MSKQDRIHISEEYHDIKGCAPIFWTLVAIALFWLAVIIIATAK
jgi:hypothetical protein